MKWSKWLENWDMTSLKISAPFLEMEWAPQTADKDAAWELYIELLTRIATQQIPDEHGVEKDALESIYSIFPITREIIRQYGRDCSEFTKIAIVVLNQIVRPFTTKWHRLEIEGALKDAEKANEFRVELRAIQQTLMNYTKMLGNMAGVEDDLTGLEGN